MRIKNITDFIKSDYFDQMLELIRDLHRIDQRDSTFKKLQDDFKLAAMDKMDLLDEMD